MLGVLAGGGDGLGLEALGGERRAVAVAVICDPARRPPSTTADGRDAPWSPDLAGIAERTGLSRRTVRRYCAAGLGGWLAPGWGGPGGGGAAAAWADPAGRLTVRFTAGALAAFTELVVLDGERFGVEHRYTRCSAWEALGAAAGAVAAAPWLAEWSCHDALTLTARLLLGGELRTCGDIHGRLAGFAGIDRAEASRSMLKLEQVDAMRQGFRVRADRWACPTLPCQAASANGCFRACSSRHIRRMTRLASWRLWARLASRRVLGSPAFLAR